jgi:hypothetical protein
MPRRGSRMAAALQLRFHMYGSVHCGKILASVDFAGSPRAARSHSPAAPSRSPSSCPCAWPAPDSGEEGDSLLPAGRGGHCEVRMEPYGTRAVARRCGKAPRGRANGVGASPRGACLPTGTKPFPLAFSRRFGGGRSMPPDTDGMGDAERRWRALARQARARAEILNHPESRRLLQFIADRYDFLAERSRKSEGKTVDKS